MLQSLARAVRQFWTSSFFFQLAGASENGLYTQSLHKADVEPKKLFLQKTHYFIRFARVETRTEQFKDFIVINVRTAVMKNRFLIFHNLLHSFNRAYIYEHGIYPLS